VTKKLVDHLARCGSTVLTPLLGDTTVELLGKIGNDAVSQRGLSFLIVSMRGEEGALRCSAIRKILIAEMSEEEGTSLCELLQLPTLAPFLTLSGADFEGNISNFEILMRWFGVPIESTGVVHRDQAESSRKAVASQQLRSHQLTAFRNLRKAIGGSATSTLVHMPIGAGKLRLVVTAVLDLYRSESDGLVIVWLTPGEALCEEAFTELREVWEQLGSHDVTIYRLYGGRAHPDLSVLSNCIIVADITKIQSDNKGLTDLGRKSRVVVLGDAGHVGHPTGAAILEMMSRHQKLNLIGISASPGKVIESRPYGDAVRESFSDACITMGEGANRLLREVGEMGEIDLEIFPTDWEMPLANNGDGLDCSDEFIDRLSQHVGRNQRLLDLLLNKSQEQGRIVFYATTADHARLFAGLLGIRGVRAMSVTSQKSIEDRARVIEKFNARDEKVLCIHGFFISGDSIPELSIGIIAAPTLSESVIQGMIGRLANGPEAQGKPIKIVALADSIPNWNCPVETFGSWNNLDF